METEKKHPEKQMNPILRGIREHPLFIEVTLAVVVACLVGGYLYIQDMQSKIYIEKARIEAPVIEISPSLPGVMDKLYVEEGQTVAKGQKLAKVGDEVLTAGTRGTVVWVKDTPGAYISPHETVVKIINPQQLRLVGRLQEDKGLRDVQPGQRIVFTVDAFGPKQYNASVERVAEAAEDSDIVFSISDKRESREFEVFGLFDYAEHPELKSGMSARMWIYK
ncbi:MAG TPA: HlyD family efflux transporter periplasmic adaptor subunit [Candidatus Bilamarchaeum sp.]|nr:HlyD family efflux transporter periplasmic adaptor subunit [Candidatus Bilamarchaeum sp.]